MCWKRYEYRPYNGRLQYYSTQKWMSADNLAQILQNLAAILEEMKKLNQEQFSNEPNGYPTLQNIYILYKNKPDNAPFGKATRFPLDYFVHIGVGSVWYEAFESLPHMEKRHELEALLTKLVPSFAQEIDMFDRASFEKFTHATWRSVFFYFGMFLLAVLITVLIIGTIVKQSGRSYSNDSINYSYSGE